jgi:hypothetical protein
MAQLPDNEMTGQSGSLSSKVTGFNIQLIHLNFFWVKLMRKSKPSFPHFKINQTLTISQLILVLIYPTVLIKLNSFLSSND